MKYFAIIDSNQSGPFTLEELCAAGVRPDTYVWCKGMDDWKQAAEVADICRFFRIRLSERMHPVAEMPDQPAEQTNTERRTIMLHGGIEIEAPDPESDPVTGPPANIDVQPANRIFTAALSLLFFPTGIIATMLAVETQKIWRRGDKLKSHETDRATKMWTGISYFLGLAMWAFITRFFL